MSRFVCFALVAALSLVALGGCASPPIRSDYSQEIPPLKDGEYVDKIWFDDDVLKTIRYSEVRLGAIRGFGVSDQTNITVAEAVRWLREATIEPGTESVVLRSTTRGQAANMELLITELNPGSTAARFWAGEFGAGHAWVQVEGKVFDANNQRLLGYFVKRERKSGVATLRNSRGYDSGPGLIRDMIRDIGDKIRQELASALQIRSEREQSAMKVE